MPKKAELQEDEKKDKKDSRLRIKDGEEGFTFMFGDSAHHGQNQRKVGEGVTLFFASEGRFVEALFFAKPDFAFEDVEAWLKKEGFDPSPQQEAKLEESKEKLVYLENVETGGKFTFNEVFTEDETSGETWLHVDSIAIAPGTWKDLNFSLELLHGAVDKFEGVNICEHHNFEEPGDVKGRTLSAGRPVDEGIRSSFVVFDKDSIRKVKNGFFHSVSSNFLLTIDDANNVTEINKVLELTLTDNPACEDAVIENTKPIELTANTSIMGVIGAEAVAATDPNTVVAVFTKNEDQPPLEEESYGGNMSEEVVTPEQTSTELEEEKNIALAEELKSANKRIAEFEKAEATRLEEETKQLTVAFSKKWIEDEKKVAPAVKEQLEGLYVKLEGDDLTSLEAILGSLNTVLPLGDEGVPMSESPAELEKAEEEKEYTETEYGKILFELKKVRAKGTNALSFDKDNFEVVPGALDHLSNRPVEFDSRGNAFIKENE